MKIFFRSVFITAGTVLFFACTSAKPNLEEPSPIIEEYHLNSEYQLRQPQGEPVSFKETWGYVSQFYIKEYSPEFPLTDVCLFAADVNCYGEIIDAPVRSKITVPEGTRVHFTMICDGKTLTHMVIAPELGQRDRIISEIVNLASDFDGIQLDYELIPQRDKFLYLEFVKKLRQEMNKKNPEQMLSVCVPARVKISSTDIFSYQELAQICDRVFVMSYDEHWSTSKPGAIASINWSRQICEFAKSQIPSEKLIMGIPFYGRSWTNKNAAGAWYFQRVQKILQENQIKEIEYEDDIPTFEHTEEIKVKTYFNDAYSVHKLCQLYHDSDIQKVGFWRIGHEDPAFWDWIKVTE